MKDVVVATESVTDLKKKKQSCDVVVVEKEDLENAFFSLPSSYGYRPWPAFFQTNNSTVLALHLVKETGYPKGCVKALGRPLMRPVGRCWRTHSLSKEYQVTLSNFHGLQLTDQISHWYTYYYVCMKKVGMCVYSYWLDLSIPHKEGSSLEVELLKRPY